MQRTCILLVRVNTNDKKILDGGSKSWPRAQQTRWPCIGIWAVCFNTQELVWWLYTHARMHTNCMHATLTRTHAPTHARNTHTYTRSHAGTQHSHAHTHARMHTPVHHTTNTHSHAQVLNLHVHVHTSCPDRHIHNQVIPAHRLESCRACINLCLSDLFPMRTGTRDPQGTWLI